MVCGAGDARLFYTAGWSRSGGRSCLRVGGKTRAFVRAVGVQKRGRMFGRLDLWYNGAAGMT